MNTLRSTLKDYLDTRRALGFKLRAHGKSLENFVAYLDQQGASYISTDLALRWATRSSAVALSYQAHLLAHIRIFAAWRKATDRRTEIPPRDLLPYKYQRKKPFIYSDRQVSDLLAAARTLPSFKGMRARTYTTMFGLIAVTGMRISEAVDLDRTDVDLRTGVITIRRTKFGKTRMVPVHKSTITALRRYAEARDATCPTAETPAFFVSDYGKRVTTCSTEYNFACASRRAGLRGPAEGYRNGRGPRVHDLRHRFAVNTLIAWYRAGLDAERELPKLSAYLGHVHVANTYWYIEAVPELLRLATERLERASEKVRP